MELFKVLFWIATLYGCLEAHPRGKRSDSKIDKMLEHVKCEPDSIFYTPENVEDKCITAALECVRREFGTVEQECEDPYEYIQAGIHYLQKLIKDRLDKDYALNSSECPCESWPETPFNNFLNKTETLCEFSISQLNLKN